MALQKALKQPAELSPEGLDSQMLIIKEFIDEFYDKTVFRSQDRPGADMSPALIKFLFAFHRDDETYPIGTLADNARVKRSTMTDMVDRMENDAIVERFHDEEDRRVVRVRLTPKGKKLRQEFYVKRRQEFEELFSQIKTSDVKSFMHHISEALKILKKIR